MTETIEIEGWKGKSGIELRLHKGDYEIIERRKNKETGEIDEHIIHVPFNNVDYLWNLIKKSCDLEQKYGYRFIVSKMINELNLNIDLDSWNGGKNRNKYYFPYYYYPMKVLEAKGYVQYFGDGGVQRLR